MAKSSDPYVSPNVAATDDALEPPFQPWMTESRRSSQASLDSMPGRPRSLDSTRSETISVYLVKRFPYADVARKRRWTSQKFLLLVCNTLLFLYGLGGLVIAFLTWCKLYQHAEVALVGETNLVVVSLTTLALMAISRRFLLALPLVPFGVLVFNYIMSLLSEPFGQIQSACIAHSQVADYPDLRTVYTGTGVDGFLCLIVVFFRECLADRTGKAGCLTIIDLLAVTLAVMSMEGSRKGLSWTILACVPLFGILAQLVGVSVMVPTLWIPIYEFYRPRLETAHGVINQKEAYIPPARAMALVPATFLGTLLPSAIMIYAPERTKFQEDIIAVWQIFPLFPTILYVILTPLISHFVIGSEAKLYAQRSSYVTQQVMIALAILSVIQHVNFLSYVLHHVSWSDVMDTINFKHLLTATTPLIAKLQWSAAKFILVDDVVLFASMGYWLLLETGSEGLVKYLALTPFVGAGGALALTCAWREKIMLEDDDAMFKKSK